MSFEDVKKTEGMTPSSEGLDKLIGQVILEYEIMIEQREVVLTYLFTNSQLSGVTFRYYWGYWQKDKNKHSISDRLYSIANVFRTLENKGYIPFGKWRFPRGYYSEYKDFTDCQQYSGPFKYTNNNIKKLQNCYDIAMKNPKIVGKSILSLEYNNEQTNVYLRFPTPKYDYQTYHDIICWIKFLKSGFSDAF
jgi:hypothetical protein